MRKMKLPVLPSTFFTVARRMATLSAAIIMLLVVTATAEIIIDPALVERLEIEHGVEIGAPNIHELETQGSCLTDIVNSNNGCFQDFGDRFIVYDALEDGASATVYWWTNYGRAGLCYNGEGFNTWAECNYDMLEKGTVFWHTCYQDQSAGGPLICTDSYDSEYIDGEAP